MLMANWFRNLTFSTTSDCNMPMIIVSFPVKSCQNRFLLLTACLCKSYHHNVTYYVTWEKFYNIMNDLPWDEYWTQRDTPSSMEVPLFSCRGWEIYSIQGAVISTFSSSSPPVTSDSRNSDIFIMQGTSPWHVYHPGHNHDGLVH